MCEEVRFIPAHGVVKVRIGIGVFDSWLYLGDLERFVAHLGLKPKVPVFILPHVFESIARPRRHGRQFIRTMTILAPISITISVFTYR